MKLSSWLTLCDDERRLALRPLCMAGLTDREIADRFGAAKGSISHFLSTKARDLQALRRERAADRLDGVVADARAAVVAPPAERDRIAGLESSVAALTATVGEVLDVVRGIAAQLADQPPAQPQPSARNGDHDASPSIVDPLGSARCGRIDGRRPARRGAGSAAVTAKGAPVTPTIQSFDAPSAEAPDAADTAGSRGAAGGGGQTGAEEQSPESVAEPVPADLPARREDCLIEGGASAPAEDDDGPWMFGPGGWKRAGERLVSTKAAPEYVGNYAEPASEAVKEPDADAEEPAVQVTTAEPEPEPACAPNDEPKPDKGGRRVTAWPEERLQILRDHIKAGLSATQIAEAMGDGVTRAAIIGAASRNGIRLAGAWGGSGGSASKTAKSSPAPRRPGNVVPMRRAEEAPRPLPRSAPTVRPKRPGTLPDLIPATAVGLLDLTGSKCRFPVGESPDVIGRYLFCAADTGDLAESYCPHHRFRCTSGAVYGRMRDAAKMPGEGRAA